MLWRHAIVSHISRSGKAPDCWGKIGWVNATGRQEEEDDKTLIRDKRDRAITCVFWRNLHLTLMFSGLYKKICLKESEVSPKVVSNKIVCRLLSSPVLLRKLKGKVRWQSFFFFFGVDPKVVLFLSVSSCFFYDNVTLQYSQRKTCFNFLKK